MGFLYGHRRMGVLSACVLEISRRSTVPWFKRRYGTNECTQTHRNKQSIQDLEGRPTLIPSFFTSPSPPCRAINLSPTVLSVVKKCARVTKASTPLC